MISIAAAERDAWDSLLFSLRVADAWHIHSFVHTEGSLDFSWGFRRQAGRLLERLDRFYVGAWAIGLGGSMTIWPGTALSDHFPVSLCVQFQSPVAQRRGCRIPDAIFERSSVRDHVFELWLRDLDAMHDVDPAVFLETCVLSSTTLCRNWVQQDRVRLCRSERAFYARLSSVHRLMQMYPQDVFLAEQEALMRSELVSVEDQRAAFTYHTAVTSWILKADRMNKDFFATFKQRPIRSTIRGPRDSDGSLHTDPDVVLSIATQYFQTLFTADSLSDEALHARAEIWRHVRPAVTSTMCDALLVPFTERERASGCHRLPWMHLLALAMMVLPEGFLQSFGMHFMSLS